ncbi:MAG: sensor domain-containing diguanylate cyclase [Candidatus Acidulodesulfobacterium sp.]
MHGYEKPCFELSEKCPIKELLENKNKDLSAVIHNHKGKIYKVEAFRDDADSFLFFESHVDITNFISEIDSAKKEKESAEYFSKRLETFFDNMPAVSMIIDYETGLIVDANKRAVEFYGYSKDEFKHMNIKAINPFISNKELKDFRAKAISEGSNFAIFRHLLKSGEIRDVESYITSTSYGGKTYIQVIVNDITEKKLLEAKVKDSEEMFRTLAENLPVGIDIHKEKFIYANKTLQNMLGYSMQELQSKYFWELFPNEYHNELRESIKKGLNSIGYKYYRTDKIIKKSGEELWVYIFAVSVKYNDEIVRISSWTDITQIVNLKNVLEQERNLFKILIENIYSGIALYDKDNFIYVNSALFDLLGINKEELFGRNPIDLLNIDENQICSSNISLLNIHRTGELFSRFIYKYDKVGNIRYIDLFRTKIIYNGKDAGLAIFTDITEQVLMEQKMLIEKDKYKELSEIDPLTKIYNRRAMDHKLTEFLNLAKRYGRPFSIIMFDIDKFKNINDTFGHETGDYILKALAKAVKKELRNTDFFARYGGEEFMVLAPETSFETALELAERLRLRIENNDFRIGQKVTISLGVASLVSSDDELSFIKRADLGLYKAKKEGRNLVGAVVGQ